MTLPDRACATLRWWAFEPTSRTALCCFGQTPNQIVKVLWQRFIAKELVHRPKPLAQPIPIRGGQPCWAVSQTAGQQLHRTSRGLNGRRSHDGPRVSFLIFVQLY